MDDDVDAVEGLAQRAEVPDVAPPVGHLRPAALGRVERTASDADDPPDPVVVLEQGHQPGTERARRTGDGDGQSAPGAAHREAARAVDFLAAVRLAGADCFAGDVFCAGADFFAGVVAASAPASASSSSMPRRMPVERTSTSG
jgi:hypothetical protein